MLCRSDRFVRHTREWKDLSHLNDGSMKPHGETPHELIESWWLKASMRENKAEQVVLMAGDAWAHPDDQVQTTRNPSVA